MVPKRDRLARSRLLILVVVAVWVVPAAAMAQGDELAEVRREAAHFHQLENALEAGYQLGYRGLVTGCIAHPTEGAMGYHYFDWELFDDPTIDPLRPEGLVYAPESNGQLKLVAVEWVVPKSIWEAAGNTDPPSVLGVEMHILNPALNWYILHAWIWKHNPAGMFADWNPEVTCPAA
jgi:hypothetical protein